MAITVSPATDADMHRIFTISSLAFARNEPVWDAMHPSHWTPSGRSLGEQRMLLTKNSDPHTTYLKAVDTSTGEIVGMAKWNIWLNDQRTPGERIQGGDGDYWENAKDREFYNKMVPVFVRKRNEAIERTKGNLVSLDILTVDPAHQRKGVGHKLVEWGCQKADEFGVEAVVESSVYGRGLYEKHGFVWQEDVLVKVEGMEDRAQGSFAWLIRPAEGK